MDYSDEEEGAKEAPEEEYDDLEPPTSALASALMQKVEQKMERSPSPEVRKYLYYCYIPYMHNGV